LVRAAEQLVDDGFVVLPYTNDDPARGAPAGRHGLRGGDAAGLTDRHGAGHCQPTQHRDDRRPCRRSGVLDAGIGTASDAALAMELGCDAVLLATAVTRAVDPPAMGRRDGGRRHHRRLPGAPGGRIPKRFWAQASSPDR